MEGGQQVLQETDRVIIAAIQGEPGGRDLRFFQPAADQGGFAITGRGGNQDECLVQAAIDQVRQDEDGLSGWSEWEERKTLS